jgi:hypothetical protein
MQNLNVAAALCLLALLPACSSFQGYALMPAHNRLSAARSCGGNLCRGAAFRAASSGRVSKLTIQLSAKGDGAASPASSSVAVKSRISVAGGTLIRFTHDSSSTGTPMTAAVFIPPGVEYSSEIPAVYWLSGLTCTDENFSQKAGAFIHAAKEKIALVLPDTSPRGAGILGEDDSWDFGTGAGFYIDATAAPYDKNYNMYTYVTAELPALVEKEFKISPRLRSISGHSMGVSTLNPKP